jgi:hypothetical protein
VHGAEKRADMTRMSDMHGIDHGITLAFRYVSTAIALSSPSSSPRTCFESSLRAWILHEILRHLLIISQNGVMLRDRLTSSELRSELA